LATDPAVLDPHIPLSQPPSAKVDPSNLVLPYAEVEAEASPSSGTYSTSSTVLHEAGAEASGRRYVSLAPGQAVSVTSPIAADSLVVRYSTPDSASGGGRDGSLLVAVGSAAAQTLKITSKYSWEYGAAAWGSSNVWNQPPSSLAPRHFWDEANLRTPEFPANTAVLLTNPANSGVTVLVDLVDFETALVVAKPAGSIDFGTYGADPTGGADATSKLQSAVNAAAGGTLFVPEGTYRIGSVSVGSVTVVGAGLWRTRFVGPLSQFRFTGGVTHLSDFAVFGETNTRNDTSDAENGLAGVPGSGTLIERLWIEHKKCAFWSGAWQNAVGPTGITLSACRFRDTMADAVNLCSGTTNTTVEDCLVRNTGDDGLAAWSPTGGGPSGGNNSFLRNLVQAPWVANGIALYGGGGFTVDGNQVRDTVTTGSGIYVSATFGSWPFVGTTIVKNNLLIRAGAHESDHGAPTGAIRVLSGEKVMTGGAFQFTDNTVVAPLESAVSLQGPLDLGSLTFSGLTAQDLGSAAMVDVRSDAKGAATFTNVSTPGAASPVWRNSAGTNFLLSHP
jgi:hypothetical protein